MKVSELIQYLLKLPQDLEAHKQVIETTNYLTGAAQIVIKIQILMRPTELIIN